MFRGRGRHRRHRTRLFFFAAVETGVRQRSRRQVDFAAKVKDLRDLGLGDEAVETELLERQFQPAVDLALRQILFAFERRHEGTRQQHRRERRATARVVRTDWIGLQVHGPSPQAHIDNH